ncbi:MAG: FAD-binding protein [Planctomycetes bacterium]|nr:FAD-binding protein [Planctomycetota bacterium]
MALNRSEQVTHPMLVGPFPQGDELFAILKRTVRGDVCFDDLSRTIYATDASLYEIIPTGVVAPKDVVDVVATVKACRACKIPIVSRGGGTGLTGGAVGGGVILDCSRYLNTIGPVDVRRRRVRVGAGVVLDDLNDALTKHGLQFAPDVATSSRATIGGMIANNSCGSRSIVYGRTVDHLAEVTVVLSDGSIATWGTSQAAALVDKPPVAPDGSNGHGSAADRIEHALADIRDRYREEIEQRFPKVLRRNGGYGLDRLVEIAPGMDPSRIVCGSEGTLCVVTEAVLNLVPLPLAKALCVLHFNSLSDALGMAPALLEHRPAAIELVDRMILNAARRSRSFARRGAFIQGDPAAILIVELFDDHDDRLRNRLQALTREVERDGRAYAVTQVTDPAEQTHVWQMRKNGLGLLMSQPGDRQPYAFVEDAAVDPHRLGDYIERVEKLLAEEGVGEVGYYAHASVGCIHVRPVLNLRQPDDVQRLYRIADRVSDLVLEFGGAMTGEHGDGLVRSCWAEKMFGPALMAAFREVKAAFDPNGLFNPGKIVDAPAMNENLRTGPDVVTRSVTTNLDFSRHGGMAGLAGMCSGVGECRQRLVGTMCPSFMATGNERDTTRARANALRTALSNRGLLDGLDDERLAEVMDLCIGCKACKTECPTGVDMARLKAEWQSHCSLRTGVSRRSRLIASAPQMAPWGSRFAPLSNWLLRSAPIRMWMDRRYGFTRQIPLPPYARRTFRHWWAKHIKRLPHGAETPRGKVAYFVDTWTNHHTPQVGIAVVRLLEAAGYLVIVPQTGCCGRPLISQGLLTEAKQVAEQNVKTLSRFADADVPIVGSEPSCILTFIDEVPQLVRTTDAAAIAAHTWTVEAFLHRLLKREPEALSFTNSARTILYHGHCHQKALVGTDDALELLNVPPGYRATEINSGCCGMAGSFGHESEHYQVSRAIGEQRLFPAIRARGDAEIAVSGFSCRAQCEHHVGVHARHVVEHLADALLTRADETSVSRSP